MAASTLRAQMGSVEGGRRQTHRSIRECGQRHKPAATVLRCDTGEGCVCGQASSLLPLSLLVKWGVGVARLQSTPPESPLCPGHVRPTTQKAPGQDHTTFPRVSRPGDVLGLGSSAPSSSTPTGHPTEVPLEVRPWGRWGSLLKSFRARQVLPRGLLRSCQPRGLQVPAAGQRQPHVIESVLGRNPTSARSRQLLRRL